VVPVVPVVDELVPVVVELVSSSSDDDPWFDEFWYDELLPFW
jgi:hypothetical protein